VNIVPFAIVCVRVCESESKKEGLPIGECGMYSYFSFYIIMEVVNFQRKHLTYKLNGVIISKEVCG